MGFVFGNTTDMVFVKAINIKFISFVLKQDAQSIQKGLSIRTEFILDYFSDNEVKYYQ